MARPATPAPTASVPATPTPAASAPAASAPATPQTGNQVLDGILAAVNAVLEPGERLEAGCDGKVTKEIPFLQNETGDWAVWHPHFVAVTNRRVLLFVMSFKPMKRGLAGVALRHEASLAAVTVARFKSGLGSAQLDLRFEDGTVCRSTRCARTPPRRSPGCSRGSALTAAGAPWRQAWASGRQAGSRPVRPMSRSSSGASSGTRTGEPNSPSVPSGFCATACWTNS